MAQPNKMSVDLIWKKGEYIEAKSRLNNDPRVTLVRIEEDGKFEKVFDSFQDILQEHFKDTMKLIHDDMVT